MSKYVLTREQMLKMLPVLNKHRELFYQNTPSQMVKRAKAMGLGRVLPKTKEQMVLLIIAFKNLQHDKKMWPMVKEIRADQRGEISFLMGNVDQAELDKHKTYVVPKGGLYDLKKELRSIY